MSNLPVEYKESIIRRFFNIIKRFFAIEEVEEYESAKAGSHITQEKLTLNEIIDKTEKDEKRKTVLNYVKNKEVNIELWPLDKLLKLEKLYDEEIENVCNKIKTIKSLA